MHGDHPFLSQWLSAGRTRVWGCISRRRLNLLFGEDETALEARLGPAELARKGFLHYYICTVLCCSALGSSPPGTRLYSLLGWALSPPGMGCSPPQVGSVTHSAPYPGAQPPGPGSGGWLSEARALP